MLCLPLFISTLFISTLYYQLTDLNFFNSLIQIESEHYWTNGLLCSVSRKLFGLKYFSIKPLPYVVCIQFTVNKLYNTNPAIKPTSSMLCITTKAMLLTQLAGFSFLNSLVAHTARVFVLVVFDFLPLVSKAFIDSFSLIGKALDPKAIARSL